MCGDAVGHLSIVRLGRGDVDAPPCHAQHQFLGKPAFAGPRAAGNEDRLAHDGGTKQKGLRKESPLLMRHMLSERRLTGGLV